MLAGAGARARERVDHLQPAPRAEAGELLGIPFDEVMHAALILVAYTGGTDFRPAARGSLDTMVQWDR